MLAKTFSCCVLLRLLFSCSQPGRLTPAYPLTFDRIEKPERIHRRGARDDTLLPLLHEHGETLLGSICRVEVAKKQNKTVTIINQIMSE